MPGPRTTGAALLVVALLLAAPGAVVAAAPAPERPARESPLDGRKMWIFVLAETERGRLDRIAARARAHHIDTVIIKGAQGPRRWYQLDRRVIRTLKARGLDVCGYQYVFGRRPVDEARAGARIARAGADCLVVDAEIEYERLRHPGATARRYMRSLRARVGAGYPVGLTSFPYASLHRRLPYRAFLGPGGAQYNLPQVYWRLLGDPPARALERTYRENRPFGRPILPIGQTWMAPPAAQIHAFERHAARLGARGVSYWSWQSTPAHVWRRLPARPYAPAP
jgi:hypothetical protein